jgi:hypothetical protein
MAGLLAMKAETVWSARILASASWAALPSAMLDRICRDGTARTIPVLVQKLRNLAAVLHGEQGSFSDLVVALGEEGANTGFATAAAPTGSCRDEAGEFG